MRKKVLAGAVLAMSAGLAACGQNNAQSQATEATTAPQKSPPRIMTGSICLT